VNIFTRFSSGSWKTTAIGIVSAVAGFITFSPSLFAGPKWTWVNELCKYIMIGGFAGLGFAGKDSNVTGGTKANPSNEPTAVISTTSNQLEVVPAVVTKKENQ
jgi:hypothetical protein